MGSSFAGFSSIVFDSGASWQLGGAAADFDNGQIITGFSAGDSLLLENVTASLEAYAGGALILTGVSDPSETYTLNIAGNIAGNFAASDFTVTDVAGGTVITLCFYPGTRIATPQGEVAVEALKAGDLVTTENGAKPVRWIGQSHVVTRFANKLRSLPVRIAQGALGDRLPGPSKDRVSPLALGCADKVGSDR